MLKAVIPSLAEMNFRQILLSDEKTMSYNKRWGGTISFPKSQWHGWYQVWITGNQEQYYYRYLYSVELDAFVGEIAYHYDQQHKIYITSIIIKAEFRGQGFGREGLVLLMQAAKRNGVAALCDTIAIDNPSIALFQELGFIEKWRNEAFVMLEKQL